MHLFSAITGLFCSNTSLFTPTFGIRSALVLRNTLVFILYFFVGRFDRFSLVLSSQTETIAAYTSRHYGIMPADDCDKQAETRAYRRDQLFSLHQSGVTDLVTSSQRTERGWSNRARGRRAGARVQRRITTLSRGTIKS